MPKKNLLILYSLTNALHTCTQASETFCLLPWVLLSRLCCSNKRTPGSRTGTGPPLAIERKGAPSGVQCVACVLFGWRGLSMVKSRQITVLALLQAFCNRA